VKGMVRCIRPFVYKGESYQAGNIYTLVRYDQPVVAAHPHHFEPADPNDQEVRFEHGRMLAARAFPPFAELAALDGHSSWQL
jgi:hypothetical protein